MSSDDSSSEEKRKIAKAKQQQQKQEQQKPEKQKQEQKLKAKASTTPVKAIKFVPAAKFPDPDNGLDSDTSGSESGRPLKTNAKFPIKTASQKPVVQQELRSSVSDNKKLKTLEDPVYTTKGDKLILIDKDYNVKIEDTIIVINSQKAVKIKLFPVSGSGNTFVSKRLIIKALHSPLLSHTIECGKDGCFDFDNTRTSMTIIGRDIVRLQAAGKNWIIV